jgi:NAD(P)H dehydrogenase (quinone)
MLSMICALLIYGMIIVGDPIAATGHFGTACIGRPDIKTEDNAEKLGERVASLALQLRSKRLKEHN